MGIFDSIMKKLGFGDEEKEQAAGQVNVAKEVEAAVEVQQEESAPVAQNEEAVETVEAAAEEAPVEVVEIDIEARLDALAAEHPEKLDWKVSIVDLMKLLGLDSSYSHRKELARELGCPEELMHDSAKMNMWLHKTVMVKLAENGGKVPEDLLA